MEWSLPIKIGSVKEAQAVFCALAEDENKQVIWDVTYNMKNPKKGFSFRINTENDVLELIKKWRKKFKCTR